MKPTIDERIDAILREVNRLVTRASYLEQAVMRPSAVLRPTVVRAEASAEDIEQIARTLQMDPSEVAAAHAQRATPIWEASFDGITATAITPAAALRLFDKLWWEQRGPL